MTPKTPGSNRTIPIPQFLCDDLSNYISKLYGLLPDDRIFNMSTRFLLREMSRYSEIAGVKRIRIHDLRHSHASLLIELGFNPLLIANRLGHDKVETTLNTYSHLYPSQQDEVVKKLQSLNVVPN